MRNQRCKAPQESGQLKPGGYGLDCGAYLSVMAGGELLGRFGDAGREATVKACGVATVILSHSFDHGSDLGGHVEDSAAVCLRRARPVLLIS